MHLGSEDTRGVLPRENFRHLGLPWTTLRAFSWKRKREREYRVVKKKSIASA